MDVVVFVEGLQELADFLLLVFGQFGEHFGNVADFAGDHRPAVGRKPFGDGADVGAFADEFRAGRILGDVVVLFVRQRLDFVGPGFDGGGFEVDVRIRVMRFDQADVVEDELVGAGRGELALAEQHANFRGGALHVVGVHLDDHRHVVRRAALVDDVLHHQLLVADAGPFVDGALDGVLGNALFLRLFDGRKKPRVHRRIGTAHLGGEGDFAHQLGVGLGLLKPGDQSFRV